MTPQVGDQVPRRGGSPAARRAVLLLSAALLGALAVLGGFAWARTAADGADADRTATAAAVGTPTRVEIPAIGVDAELVGVGLRSDGAMETPAFGVAGWYELGPRPGEPGPAVVAAHVDSQSGADVFSRLDELDSGDRVTVYGERGAATFTVESLEQADKDALPVDRIWNDTEKPVLRLVTCGGRFDDTTGHYEDNVIVYASLG